MIFKSWTKKQFKRAGYTPIEDTVWWERRGIPLFSSPRTIDVWIPGWASDLLYGLGSPSESSQIADFARISAAAIRSDDPDAFVETVLAAYALGGWRAALALAGAQDDRAYA